MVGHGGHFFCQWEAHNFSWWATEVIIIIIIFVSHGQGKETCNGNMINFPFEVAPLLRISRIPPVNVQSGDPTRDTSSGWYELAGRLLFVVPPH